jgi:hypothetical protein
VFRRCHVTMSIMAGLTMSSGNGMLGICLWIYGSKYCWRVWS